jgi:hypothetical protein
MKLDNPLFLLLVVSAIVVLLMILIGEVKKISGQLKRKEEGIGEVFNFYSISLIALSSSAICALFYFFVIPFLDMSKGAIVFLVSFTIIVIAMLVNSFDWLKKAKKQDLSFLNIFLFFIMPIGIIFLVVWIFFF